MNQKVCHTATRKHTAETVAPMTNKIFRCYLYEWDMYDIKFIQNRWKHCNFVPTDMVLFWISIGN